MIENNLSNFWRLGMKKKIALPFFNATSNCQTHYSPRTYDWVYMIDKYSDASSNVIQWFRQNIRSNKHKNAIEFLDVESLTCMKSNSMTGYRNIYVFDRCFNSLVHFKTSFQKILSSIRMKMSNESHFDLSSNSVDIVYSNVSLTALPASSRMKLLSETLRVLNEEGEFYFSMLTTDFYNSIYQLLDEFNPIFAKSLDLNHFIDLNPQEISKFLNSYFLEVKVEEVNSNWWVTDADDLIGYLLSDRQFISLRVVIAKYGLSNFRKFLMNKIKKDGGILVKRHVNIISSKNKCH